MKLCIFCITYNHGPFIAQALDGFLAQKTNFDFQVVVADDCSTDNTAEVLRLYAEKNPGRLTVILNETNKGQQLNFSNTYDACISQYIAFCEGDDYWTDPYKLQKQADFLDANPDYVLVYHNVEVKFEGNSCEAYLYCKSTQSGISETSDLLKNGNIIPSCSSVFRKECISEVPEWVKTLGMSDWPFNFLLSRQGKLRYLNEVMGVYRLHSGGNWSANNSVKNNQMVIEAYRAFLKNIHLTPEEKNICKSRMSFIRNRIYADLLLQKRKKEAGAFLIKRVTEDPLYIFNIRFLKNIKHYLTTK
ncbi:MAG: glycosyltransferase [Chitinophagaceae bacterium]